MASKYGKGYYSDWYEMIQSIERGSEKAFEDTCNEICEEVNERIRGGIYLGDHDYDRTFEMWEMEHYVTCEVHGLECQFLYDGKEFDTLSIDSIGHKVSDSADMAHHALSGDSGNGYSVQEFMDEIISPIHDDFMVDIREYIYKEFPKRYRANCEKIGFRLS